LPPEPAPSRFGLREASPMRSNRTRRRAAELAGRRRAPAHLPANLSSED
jgi:hypothetical protein